MARLPKQLCRRHYAAVAAGLVVGLSAGDGSAWAAGTITSAQLPAVSVVETAVVEFQEATRTVGESTLNPFPWVTVIRRGDTAAPASISYAATGGTATRGVDFELLPGTLSFAAGETSKVIPLKIYPDLRFEPDETILVTLGSPSEGTSLGAASLTVTIADDDAPRLQFGTFGFVGSESAGSATVTVTRAGDPAVPVGVAYSTSDQGALAGADYTATSGALSFGAGETSKSFTVPILDDVAAERTEVARLTLSAPTGGAVVGAPSWAWLVITDNDPALRFGTGSYSAVENGGTATVSVHRDGSGAEPVTVDYATTDGTATAGTDYAATSGTLTFAAGETTKTIPVRIADDATPEAAETLTVSLSSPSAGAHLGSLTAAKVTIAASDQQPDGLVSTASTTGYVGNNVYNTTGAGQTATVKARRTQARTFHVRVQNDGHVPNTIAIRGTAAVAGSTVQYFSGTTDITRAMRSAAGWKVGLRPGGFQLLTVRVKVLSGAAFGSVKSAKVSGTWTGDSRRADVVTTAVKVVR